MYYCRYKIPISHLNLQKKSQEGKNFKIRYSLTKKSAAFSQKLLLFDGLQGILRTIKLRERQHNCPVCGDNPSIPKLIDYEQFCGARANDKVSQFFCCFVEVSKSMISIVLFEPYSECHFHLEI